MVVLGLVLLLIVAIVVIGVVFRGNSPVSLDLQWFTVSTNARAIFITGIVITVLAVCGFLVIRAGLKRGHRRRTEMRGLRDRAHSQEAIARREQAANVQQSGAAEPADSAVSAVDDGPEATGGTTSTR